MTHPDLPHPAEAPQTQRALMAEACRRLEAAGVEAARRNAEWAMEEVLGMSRAMLYAHSECEVTSEQAARVRAVVARRAAGEPIQYILGHAAFYGLRLRVTPDVLIPRPETEEVAEQGLRLIQDVRAPRVLDVGTGSGCIALALRHERPDADVHACDVSRPALEVAAANAAAHHLDVRFTHADMLQAKFTTQVPRPLDLLISNPPYVPDAEAPALAPEVVRYEPAAALFAGRDPLRFYRALVRHAPRLLAPGGILLCETHTDYASDVQAVLAEGGLEGATVKRDLAGRPRIVWARQPCS